MDQKEDAGNPALGHSLFVHTAEGVATTVAAGASATPTRSPRPSVVFSSKDDDNSSPLKRLQDQVGRMLRGLSPLPEVKRRAYNPEILTSQKRQWARFQMEYLDNRSIKEPARLFESMVVVGLHPNTDVRDLKKQILERNNEDTKKSRGILSYHHQVHADLNLEPQVLFAYPQKLPLKYKDLLSFCFPAGVEVRAVERTPSLSELNQILLGQEQLKQSDVSFVFRLQVADNSTLYGCCLLIEEIIQKPSTLVSRLLGEPTFSPLSRHILTTTRCYCILSRLPFFDLHFGILRSIFTEERFEGLSEGIEVLNLLSLEEKYEDDNILEKSVDPEQEQLCAGDEKVLSEHTNQILDNSLQKLSDNSSVNNQLHKKYLNAEKDGTCDTTFDNNSEIRGKLNEGESDSSVENDHSDSCNEMRDKQSEGHLPRAVFPLVQPCRREKSKSLTSLQVIFGEDRNHRSEMDENEFEEPSSSGQEDFNCQTEILNWAKANKHGSLQIICEYYRLQCPSRGSSLTFQPLEHLDPLEFHRSGETALHVTGSTIDLRSCSTSLEMAEAHGARLAEEEASALSVWTVACICGNLRLEHVMLMFAGALLEKQIVIVCSNLGFLSASVLSIIPLIRPYQWESLLMPVLPTEMLDFLDAPVPYIIGIKNKTAEIQSKLASVILIDANKNQVKSPSMPQLPQHKELFSSLSPYHAKLVGESYLARKRPVYECTDVQIEAAKGFLAVLRSYLDSLCSNLRSHTITNVQSNDDKVSLLLKESFIDSFPNRDRPFMKLFVDTQLFSGHTDLVLSFYQKD